MGVAGLQFIGEVGGQHFELPGEPHHCLAGLGEFNRTGPPQDRAADGNFEGADALADGGGGNRQMAGRGIEAALRDDGRQRPGLVRMDVDH